MGCTTSCFGSVFSTSTPPSRPITRGRIQWRGGSSIKQSFSLPDTIMFYITKNPSSAKGYLKFAQSCKFFFERNPVLVVAQIRGKLPNGCIVFGNTKICSKTLKECKKNNGKCCIYLDIKKLSSKIWLTDNQLILPENVDPNYTSVLCPKLYRSEIDRLELYHRTVFLDDFKFLVSSVTTLDLKNVRIINNDGSIVLIDEILEFVPKLKVFYFCFTDIKSTSTFKSITKLNNLGHLKHLLLHNIPAVFTVGEEDILNFMKAHKGTMFSLNFGDTISEDYKDQLDDLIDDIIVLEIPDQIITYDGLDEERFFIMENRMTEFLEMHSFNYDVISAEILRYYQYMISLMAVICIVE